MFKIEITGSTYAELRDNLVEVFAGLDLKQPTPVKIDNSYPEKADQFDNAIPFPEKEEVQKDAPVEKAEEAAPETKVAPTETAAAVTVTFQDIKDLISKAVTNKKAADVKKILAKFGAKKPSEFQEADYPTIANELKELV